MSEKMKAVTLSLLATVVIGAAAWVVVFRFFDDESPATIVQTPAPGLPTELETDQPNSNTNTATSTRTGSAYNVKGEDGRIIAVRDFTDSAVEDKNNRGVMYLAGEDEEGFVEETPYVISFFSEDQSFTVSLFAQPINAIRRRAESDLLNQLGLSEGEACFLRYVVLVPFDIDKNYAGRNLGFSFCPGAVELL